MPQEITDKLPTYLDLGFDKFMTKTTGNPMFGGVSSALQGGGSRTLNFDQVQTSGSLGDKIQIGPITIDGTNKRIIVSDGENDRILIGFDKDGF